MTNRFRRDAAVVLVAVCGACSPDAIEWNEPALFAPGLETAGGLSFDAQHRLVGRPAATATPSTVAGQCVASVHVARDTTGDWYAVWWAVRPDSTADLVVSRSTDGTTWSAATKVDSTDAGRVGCQRPPPSIAADRDNVHVAYAMAAKEGPGIFASHSMDRGMTFHTPVAVVYGERLGLTAIAARGDTVAVAYEDPNSDPQRVGLVFSRTMGHTFEARQLVSPVTSPAHAPGVAVGGGRIAVTWLRGAATDVTGARVVRTGVTR